MKNEKEFLRQKEVLGKAIMQEFSKHLSQQTNVPYKIIVSSKFEEDKLGPGLHGFSDNSYLYLIVKESRIFGSDIIKITINFATGLNEVEVFIKDKKNRENIIRLISNGEYQDKFQDLLGAKPKFVFKE